GHDTADEDDDETNDQVPHSQRHGGQAKGLNTGSDAEPHKQLTRVDVGEDTQRRVNVGHSGIVERRLEALREEATHGVGHGVGQEEHGQEGQQDVAHGVVNDPVAGSPLTHLVDLLGADEGHQGVNA